jgi:hypothetical protein
MNMLQKNESNVNKFVAIDLHRKNFFATIFNTETKKVPLLKFLLTENLSKISLPLWTKKLM